MSSQISRRRFVVSLGSLAAALALPVRTLVGVIEPPLYPPMDLSYFDKPISPSPSEIRFGSAAITSNGDDVQAVKELGL